MLIGSAGTGKTACLKKTLQAVTQLPTETPLKGEHKYLRVGSPSSVCVAYTRRAVQNIARATGHPSCLTIHKTLEYSPTYEEVFDTERGEMCTTMRFRPLRTQHNPLEANINRIIIDEASMVSLELHEELVIANPHGPQYIYIGDINQLPPVFGSAVLGYKMLELPVIELTEIYRQAAGSPIIKYAAAIKTGETFHFKEKHVEETPTGKITFHPWKKPLNAEDACTVAASFLKVAYDNGVYNPDEHMVLCPFNKAFGTIELNKHIANHLARKLGRITYEIIAGFNYHYLSPGDKVMYEKQDAHIISINPNSHYTSSKRPKPHSATLDYWGGEQGAQVYTEEDIDIDDMLDKLANCDDEDRINAASHVITLRLDDDPDVTIAVDKSAQINALLLGYCLTTHKAQGAEWDKVFILYHQSHNNMLCREQLYTALTRARTEAYVVCEPDTFVKGVKSQRIKGNTLEEKAEYFKGKTQ